MALEETNQNDTTGQPDEAAEQNPTTSLPDDPAERATLLEQRLQDAERRASQLEKEKRQIEDYAKEQELAKKTWYERANNLEQERGKQQAAPTPRKQRNSVLYDAEGKPRQAIDAISDGITTEDLVGDRPTREEVEELIKESIAATVKGIQQHQTKGNQIAHELVTEFPDIAEKNSKLTKEATTIFVDLQSQRPELDDTDRWELAVVKAARRINYSPKKTDPQAEQRDRLRNGQGNAGQKTNSGKATLDIDDAQLARLARQMNQGVDLSPAALKATKERMAADLALKSR